MMRTGHGMDGLSGRGSSRAGSQGGFIFSASPGAIRETAGPARVRRGGGGGSSRAGSQGGFIMALLLIFIAIMGVMLMKATPYAIAEVRRDQEAELIFRGEAIARAIRLYQMRTGGYPASLDMLAQLRPRILRRVYKDPMTKDGEWRKIYAVQPGASGDATGLPIVGVASQSEGDSYRIYKGRTQYNDWIFAATDNILGVPLGMGVARPTGAPTPQPTGGDTKR